MTDAAHVTQFLADIAHDCTPLPETLAAVAREIVRLRKIEDAES